MLHPDPQAAPGKDCDSGSEQRRGSEVGIPQTQLLGGLGVLGSARTWEFFAVGGRRKGRKLGRQVSAPDLAAVSSAAGVAGVLGG